MPDLTPEDFHEGRYSRLELISWWEQDKLRRAKVFVVGAGAVGNELVKNLALLGVGDVYIADMDKIEHSNLARSVLFRASDVGRYKAEAAAERAMELNPDVRAHPMVADVVSDVGLGFFRRMDVVLGGLDNREARLAVNQCCYKAGKAWIDGAIEALGGFARVFAPGVGACYECTMTETDWKLVNKRKSCALLTHEQMSEGKVPTTPTSSSVIAGIQVQEMLKLLHGLPVLAGKGYVFNGLTHDSYVVEYQRKDDCLSHDAYDDVIEKPWTVSMTVGEILAELRAEAGDAAVVELDREIAVAASCACGNAKDLLLPVHKLRKEALRCGKCGADMRFDSTHTVNGREAFAGRSFADMGVPPFHVIACRNGREVKYYEFAGDRERTVGNV